MLDRIEAPDRGRVAVKRWFAVLAWWACFRRVGAQRCRALMMLGRKISRWLLAFTFILAAIGLGTGCGGSAGGGASPEAGGVVHGEVVERAEGFSSRPPWADPGMPVSKKDDTLRVTGYLVIDEGKRIETGYKATDSYARAELIRFLATRVVAVLEHKIDSKGAEELSETIKTEAGAWVVDIPVAARYWEKRKNGGKLATHLYSRVDLSPQQLTELTDLVLSQSQGLDTSVEILREAIKSNLEELVDPSSYRAGSEVPPGTFMPSWAEAGDRETDSSFHFVCHGFGESEEAARLSAESRCSEKLCRTFGVQITAETSVVEDMDSLSAKSEVRERCPAVRVVGRETRYKSGSCEPEGCIYWIQQDYPKASYEAEKQRLEQPTVIHRQVVIQEGDKHYRDPAECQKDLDAYGRVEGVELAHFVLRQKHLKRALASCQGIDEREVGLFESLNLRLTDALPKMSVRPGSQGWGSENFLLLGDDFIADLRKSRFFVERIQLVLGFVEDALLPLSLYALDKGSSEAEVAAVMKRVVALPLREGPSSRHHRWSVLYIALRHTGGEGEPPYSKVLRDFIVDVAPRAKITCDHNEGLSGALMVSYLGRDGQLDETEWRVAKEILQRSKSDIAARNCISSVWGQSGRASDRRMEELTRLLLERQIVMDKPVATFESLLRGMDGPSRLKFYQKYAAEFGARGPEGERLRDSIMGKLFPRPTTKDNTCPGMARQVEEIVTEWPEFDVDEAPLCTCLYSDYNLSPSERAASIQVLNKFSRKSSCDQIKNEEWPGGYYSGEPPTVVPWGQGGTPFGHMRLPLDEKVIACRNEHNPVPDRQVHIGIEAVVAGGRIRNPKVTAKLLGAVRYINTPPGQRGYVQTEVLRRANREIAACTMKAIDGAVLPPEAYVLKQGDNRRIYFEYYSDQRGVSIYRD
jgi:hypothetical protein